MSVLIHDDALSRTDEIIVDTVEGIINRSGNLMAEYSTLNDNYRPEWDKRGSLARCTCVLDYLSTQAKESYVREWHCGPPAYVPPSYFETICGYMRPKQDKQCLQEEVVQGRDSSWKSKAVLTTAEFEQEKERSKEEVGVLRREAIVAAVRLKRLEGVVDSMKSAALATTRELEQEKESLQRSFNCMKLEQAKEIDALKKEACLRTEEVEGLRSEARAQAGQLEYLEKMMAQDLRSEALSSSVMEVDRDETQLDEELYGAIEQLKEHNQGVVNVLRREAQVTSARRVETEWTSRASEVESVSTSRPSEVEHRSTSRVSEVESASTSCSSEVESASASCSRQAQSVSHSGEVKTPSSSRSSEVTVVSKSQSREPKEDYLESTDCDAIW